MASEPTGSGAEPTRVRSRRGQGEQLRREILAGVQHLLAEWGGADKLTMRAVAKEVGISAPSIYLHFTDKTELVWAALADKYGELVAQMAAAESDTDGDARRRLHAQGRAYCRFAMRNPGHYRLMFEVHQPKVEASRISAHPARHVSASLRGGFAQCQDAGYALSMPVAQAAQTLWAGLHGTVALHHSLFHDEASESLTLLLSDGLVDSLVASTPGANPPFATVSGETDASRRIQSILSGSPLKDGQ
ncbi:TetR/AcrR family transcriptional regulator [Streptomyces sp. NBC_00483]